MRRAAALLAGFALLALPFRALVACTMPVAEVAHAVESAAPDDSAHHAHHSDAPLPTQHDSCPDVASCAAVAILVSQALPVLEPASGEDGARAPVRSLDAPVRTLDPPPPKR